MRHGVVFSANSDQATKAIRSALERQGLSAVRSFDLRAALSTQSDCVCLHHGTAECGCQFAVLLVYGEHVGPVTLTIHSDDHQTEAQIVRDPAAPPDPQLVESLMAALFEAALVAQSATLHPVPTDAGR